MAEVRRRGLEHDHAVEDGWRYVRFRRPETPIPHEVGFLIADLVVNARSCLDMAVDQVAYWHCPDWKQPQFPIRDITPRKKDGRYEAAMTHLPAAYRQAVQALQPRDLPEFDVPFNRVALAIRDLSNTNKHRNLTPAVHVPQGHGMTHTPELGDVELHWPGPRHGEGTLWEPDPTTIFVIGAPADEVSESALVNVEPHAGHTLCVYRDPRRVERWRNDWWLTSHEVPDLPTKVPKYVEAALSMFRRAREWTATEGEETESPDMPDLQGVL